MSDPHRPAPFDAPPMTANELENNAAVRMLIPIGRSGWAIAAGYLALFSMFPIVCAVTLLVSIIAMRDLSKNKDKHGWGRAIFGLVMGTLFTLFWAVLLIKANMR